MLVLTSAVNILLAWVMSPVPLSGARSELVMRCTTCVRELLFRLALVSITERAMCRCGASALGLVL